MSSLVYLDWSIHKKQLVKSCCIQKDNPNNTCQASCCLKKSLDKTSNKSTFTFSFPRLTWFASWHIIVTASSANVRENGMPNAYYLALHSLKHVIGLIKPPSFLI